MKNDIYYSILDRFNKLEKCDLNTLYKIIEYYNKPHYLYFKTVINEKNPKNLLSYIKRYYSIQDHEIVNYNSILYQYVYYNTVKFDKINIFEKLKKKIIKNKKIINENILLKGRRKYMEDNLLIINNVKHYISLVLDGHGGKECSEFIKKNFYNIFLEKENIYKRYSKILYETIKKINNLFLKSSQKSGSTLNLLFINKNTKKYYVLNVGDSRCLVNYNNGQIKQISNDHRLNIEKERDRIYLKGGVIINNRVNGMLGMSRSLGDKNLSKIISSKPDLYFGYIKNIKYFIQGTDGVFDYINNNELIEYINKEIIKYKKKYIFMKNLGRYIYKNKKSEDNITISLSYVV